MEFRNVGLSGGKKNRRKTPADKRELTTNSKRIGHIAGIEPGPHWERRAQLAIAPSLLPNIDPLGLLFLLGQ